MISSLVNYQHFCFCFLFFLTQNSVLLLHSFCFYRHQMSDERWICVHNKCCDRNRFACIFILLLNWNTPFWLTLLFSRLNSNSQLIIAACVVASLYVKCLLLFLGSCGCCCCCCYYCFIFLYKFLFFGSFAPKWASMDACMNDDHVQKLPYT